ncbi:MAG: hypothetical protein SFW35_01990 [Chitinophagales bacterium]|nr:hypothetical protein [Chitinophagales bacterium]
MEQEKVKARLLEECLKVQNDLVETLKTAIKNVQDAANDEKGGSEENFESFREQMQHDREMYTRQLEQASMGLQVLKKINPQVELDTAKLGSVVITDKLKVFLSWNMGKIKVDNSTFFVISTQAPLYDAIAGKKKGETFNFRGEDHKVLEVY